MSDSEAWRVRTQRCAKEHKLGGSSVQEGGMMCFASPGLFLLVGSGLSRLLRVQAASLEADRPQAQWVGVGVGGGATWRYGKV